MDSVRRVGKFTLLEPIGSGGFSTVYSVRENDRRDDKKGGGGALFAMKIGNDAVNDEYRAAKSIDDMMHMEEWHAYKALGFGKDDANRCGIPEVYETGIAQLPGKEYRPYLVMQLLGKSLSGELSKRDFRQKHFFRMAHELIDILKFMHGAGFIHRDIKPSNFCFGREEDENGYHPLFILDLGFACKAPTAAKRGAADFLGTPDYSSTTALQGKHQSYRDDMESLGYTLLEMWMGDLPWYLTSSQSARAGGWTRENLCNMASKRARIWEDLVTTKKIPSFFNDWINRCQSMKMTEKPDFKFFHQLVEDAETLLNSKKGQSQKRKGQVLAPKPQKKAKTSPPKKRLCQAED